MDRDKNSPVANLLIATADCKSASLPIRETAPDPVQLTRRVSLVHRAAPKALTVSAINGLKPGKMLADGAIRPGHGSLKVRKRQNIQGVIIEWLFEWNRGGKTTRQSLGRYSAAEAENCLTLAQARAKASEWQAIIKEGGDPAAQREIARETRRIEEETTIIKIREARDKSLSSLLSAYIDHLRHQGKTDSAYDAENMFGNHVLTPFASLASLPAASIIPQHISQILNRLVGPDVKKRKGRTAVKLRSYLSAAFNLAKGADLDPMSRASSSGYGLSLNPAAEVPATRMAAAFNKVGQRALSAEEFGAYLRRLEALPLSLTKLALQLQVVTGGQRIQQLLRLTAQDIDATTLTLYDAKGKRAQPRVHVLPMIPPIQKVLASLLALNCQTPSADGRLFAINGVALAVETPSDAVRKISNAMHKAKEITKEFRGGDIRRSIETLMAGDDLQVAKDVRAQIQSHGLSGVQDRHYDKSQHIKAKKEALLAWNDFARKIFEQTSKT